MDVLRDAAIIPDSVLPGQLVAELFGGARRQPEKRLQLAVLEDAVMTFHRCVGVGTSRTSGLLADVEAWFASDDTHGPFTFVTICDSLRLDADYVRRGLRQWREHPHATAQRKPPLRRAANRTLRHITIRVEGDDACSRAAAAGR